MREYPRPSTGIVSNFSSISELLHKADVAALEMADVIDAVPHHNEPVQAEAEGEPGPLVGVNAAVPQHIGMHQPAWKELHPSALLADAAALPLADEAVDIKLEAGLHEGEVSRTEADGHFAAEYLREKHLHEIN